MTNKNEQSEGCPYNDGARPGSAGSGRRSGEAFGQACMVEVTQLAASLDGELTEFMARRPSEWPALAGRREIVGLFKRLQQLLGIQAWHATHRTRESFAPDEMIEDMCDPEFGLAPARRAIEAAMQTMGGTQIVPSTPGPRRRR